MMCGAPVLVGREVEAYGRRIEAGHWWFVELHSQRCWPRGRLWQL